MTESILLYEKLLFENLDKGFQYRLTVSEFRGVEYIHIRKYFLSYEGEWVPSSEGAAIPMTIKNTFSLLEGLVEICSLAENTDIMNEYFSSKINSLKNSIE